MTITKINKNAFAILAKCTKTKKYFGISVNPIGRKKFSFVWAFPIDQHQAHKEGFDSHYVHGSISLDPNYNGCPHCGKIGFFICGACGMLACYNGSSSTVVCPHCNTKLSLTESSEFDLSGGSY